MEYDSTRSGELIRAMIDGDRECVEDVAEWMATLDAEDFNDQVNRELRGKLDQVAERALRQDVNLKRWEASLKSIIVSLQTQLADPTSKSPSRAEWRQKTLVFLNRVLQRRQEVRHLIATAVERGRGERDLWQSAKTKAVRRLIAAHENEYLRMFVDEVTAAGLEVPVNILEKLAGDQGKR